MNDQQQIETKWVCRDCVERSATRLRVQAEASTFMQDVIRQVNWTSGVEPARVVGASWMGNTWGALNLPRGFLSGLP